MDLLLNARFGLDISERMCFIRPGEPPTWLTMKVKSETLAAASNGVNT